MVFAINTSHAINLGGKYISDSGELMFTFTKDSLYVDMARSGCGISAFKLSKKMENRKVIAFDAFETYLEDDSLTYREVFIKLRKLKNKKYIIWYYGRDKDRNYNTNEHYRIRKVN